MKSPAATSQGFTSGPGLQAPSDRSRHSKQLLFFIMCKALSNWHPEIHSTKINFRPPGWSGLAAVRQLGILVNVSKNDLALGESYLRHDFFKRGSMHSYQGFSACFHIWPLVIITYSTDRNVLIHPIWWNIPAGWGVMFYMSFCTPWKPKKWYLVQNQTKNMPAIWESMKPIQTCGRYNNMNVL